MSSTRSCQRSTTIASDMLRCFCQPRSHTHVLVPTEVGADVEDMHYKYPGQNLPQLLDIENQLSETALSRVTQQRTISPSVHIPPQCKLSLPVVLPDTRAHIRMTMKSLAQQYTTTTLMLHLNPNSPTTSSTNNLTFTNTHSKCLSPPNLSLIHI